MANEVKARIIEIGDVRYEPIGDDKVRKLERGAIVQFDNVDDFKLAISGRVPVKFEWR